MPRSDEFGKKLLQLQSGDKLMLQLLFDEHSHPVSDDSADALPCQ